MLTHQQIESLGRLKIASWKIQDAIRRLNEMVKASDLPLEPMPDFVIGQFNNGIALLVATHQMEVKISQEAAMTRLEKVPA